MATPETTAPQSAAPQKKSNACIWILVIVVGVLVLLAVAGTVAWNFFGAKIATKVTESVISKASNGTVNINTDSGSVTVKGEDGATATIGSKLPDNFPTDIPIYTGATVTSGTVGKDSQGNAEDLATFTTPDSVEKVKAFYDAELAKKGWGNNESPALGTLVSYLVTKGDRQLAITITDYSSSKVTVITVIESKKN